MSSKTTSLLVISLLASLGGRAIAVEPGPKVYVVQPDTDRRVYLADLSVRTESGQPVPMRRTVMRTGLFGEPVRPEDTVDPSYGTLIVEARKHDIIGRLEVIHVLFNLHHRLKPRLVLFRTHDARRHNNPQNNMKGGSHDRLLSTRMFLDVCRLASLAERQYNNNLTAVPRSAPHYRRSNG